MASLLLQCVDMPCSAAVCRLRAWCSSEPRVAGGALRALVSISNRMIAAQRHDGGVVVGAAREAAQMAWGAARELLPFAALVPDLLLERLVSDAVHHPAQQPLALQLLGGALRPTALAALDGGAAAGGGAQAPGAPALLRMLLRLLLQPEGGVSSDGGRRALLSLLSGLMVVAGAGAAGQGR